MSNLGLVGPRKYCLRCLDHLGVREFFPDVNVFCVDDVVPACKPEAAAFQKVSRGTDGCGAGEDRDSEGQGLAHRADPKVRRALPSRPCAVYVCGYKGK